MTTRVIVVSDTSPFVVLVKIGRVELLPALFGTVVVPPDVMAELAGSKRPEAVRAFATSPPAWLEVRAPAEVPEIAGLQVGESAAIALAQELRADRIVIDEARGRREATARNLRVVGTLGLLEIAAEKKLVDLGRVFDELKGTDFWVSARLLDNRLAAFRERERKAVEHEREQREKAAPEKSPTQGKDDGHELE